jgi:hypothetical protein
VTYDLCNSYQKYLNIKNKAEMLGRPATRIDLKMEDDLQEYEEFRAQLAM